MAIYKITIEKIEKEMIEKSKYIGKDEKGANADGYTYWSEEEEQTKKLYEQRIESELFDIKKIIDAFNQ